MTTIPNRRMQIRLANLAKDMETIAKELDRNSSVSVMAAYATRLRADAEVARKWESHLGGDEP